MLPFFQLTLSIIYIIQSADVICTSALHTKPQHLFCMCEKEMVGSMA